MKSIIIMCVLFIGPRMKPSASHKIYPILVLNPYSSSNPAELITTSFYSIDTFCVLLHVCSFLFINNNGEVLYDVMNLTIFSKL
jgi:hypothetical protein